MSSRIVQEDVARVATTDLDWSALQERTIAVTGANGMLGSYLVRSLLAADDRRGLGLRVLAIVRSERKAREGFEDLRHRRNLEIHERDVSRPLVGLPQADFVIHAASQASPNYFSSDPVGTIRANTVGTFNTLDYALRSAARRYVFISTREIYGQPILGGTEAFREVDMGTVDPLDARSAYPEGKRAAETIAVAYRDQYGLDVRIARLAHTYGPGMSSRDARVQASFLSDVLAGRDIVLQSAGTLTRSYTYAADAAAAVLRILLDSEELAYNIADDDALVSIRELAEVFNAVPGREGRVVVAQSPGSSAGGWSRVSAGVVDSTRLRALGWRPSVTLAEGVERWVAHARQVESDPTV